MKSSISTFLLSAGIIAALGLSQAITEANAENRLPAFSGASGFGGMTYGGSGRHLSSPTTTIHRVSSLANAGPGTLRACVEASGPRVCIFETSGRIALTEKLEVTEPYLTIAGQTAPAPGVTLTGGVLKISTHNILVRHFAVRVGDDRNGIKPTDRDGITISGKASDASDILLDHISLSWAIDENFSTFGDRVRNVTVSNSIISEGLYRSIHPDGPHSMGILIGEGSRRISLHRNLLAHNNDRNPRQKADTELEFINNLVYNWGGLSGTHGANLSDTDKTNKATLLNFIGNVYHAGPNSPTRAPLSSKPLSAGLRVYVSDNLGPTRKSEAVKDWKISSIPETPYRMPQPVFPLSGVKVQKAAETFGSVLSNAGSRPIQRDEVDSRIIAEVKSGTGNIRDCVSGCPNSVGGWPNIPVNKKTLSPPSAPNSDTNKNGYTDLEDWLDCLAKNLEGSRTETCN